MRRGFVWGLILLLVGLLLLLQNLGVLDFLQVKVWQIIWPVAIIALGVWFLLSTRRSPNWETETLNLEYQGEERAEIRLEYGAGELSVGAGSPDSLLVGTFEGGVDHKVLRKGSDVNVRVWTPPVVLGPWPLGPGSRRHWDVRLTPALDLALFIKTGASDNQLDLRELRVTSLRIESGASSTDVVLPAHASCTEVRGSSGAASLTLHVPEGVAARIHTSGGLASTTVNTARFPRRGSFYTSPDYETAENKVNIQLDMGVGSIDIR